MVRAMCALLIGAWMVACGDDSSAVDGGTDGATGGALSLLLEAEETITEGLEGGSGDENILDGWSVTFDRYVVAIGDIDLTFSTDASNTANASEVFVVDLVQVPPTGLALWSFDSLRNGRWELAYETPLASASAQRHESVSEEVFAEMVREGWTYLVEGTISQTGGESCPPPAGTCSVNESIAFRFGAAAATAYGPCQAEDGPPGVAIIPGGTTASLTIHGDHLFFNGFPEAEEGGVMRFAQWLADCDIDLDGMVTRAELEGIVPADLAELDERYDLSSPIPLTNMWEYVRAQLTTQGHFQGEGECPPTLL